MSLWKAIHAAAEANPNQDPKKIAGDLLSRTQRKEFLDLLANEVAREQRNLVRDIERSAFVHKFIGEGAERKLVATVTFSELIGQTFSVGTGLDIEWTTATIEQHQERIAYLKKMRDGIDNTIQRHEDAIRLILEQGVSCLADIDAEAAA